MPLDVPADAAYARLRSELEKTGKLIGPNDLLIAAHALAIGAILVTANTREFKRVRGLTVENWLVSATTNTTVIALPARNCAPGPGDPVITGTCDGAAATTFTRSPHARGRQPSFATRLSA